MNGVSSSTKNDIDKESPVTILENRKALTFKIRPGKK
jgi:hypothetical protein